MSNGLSSPLSDDAEVTLEAVSQMQQYLTGGGQKDKNPPSEAAEESQESPEETEDNLEEESAEEKETADEGDEQEEQPLYSVKIDGKEEKVTLQELLTGYSRQKDYTQKTMKLAEQRKEFEQKSEEFSRKSQALEGEYGKLSELDNARKLYADRLEVLQSILNQGEALTTEDLEKVLQDQGPEAYLQLKIREDSRRENLRKIEEEKERIRGESEKAALVRLHKAREWCDAELSKGEFSELASKEGKERLGAYLQKAGYHPQEIDVAVDPRAFGIAEKARRYDEMMAAKTSLADKKVVPIPAKPLAPAAPRKSTEESKQLKVKNLNARLRQTGSLQDAAALLKEFI
jgi:hypothetical protein